MAKAFVIVLKLVDEAATTAQAVAIAERVGDELGAQRVSVHEYDPASAEAWAVYAKAVA